MISIFFFQAEDGIRDIGVTGVQTCALPIFPADYITDLDQKMSAYRGVAAAKSKEELSQIAAEWNDRYGAIPKPATQLLRVRSEERRVGKECRSRWSPYH